jgi:hypothetical protein
MEAAMAGRDDDTIHFDIDPRWWADDKPKPVSAPNPDTKLQKGRSFEIAGSVTYPEIPRPKGDPVPDPPQQDRATRTEQIVARSRSPRKQPLLHIALRIPRDLLEKLDQIAREKNTSTSQVIRTILDNAVRRKPRSAKRTLSKPYVPGEPP